MKTQHRFSQTPSVNIPRSTFNLSHGHKSAFDADDLVPICQPIDIIPGSTFNVKTSFFMRLATPLEPILDNLYFDTFAFFVPYRTIWVNHEKFHGAQDDPGDSISFTIPVMSGANAVDLGSPADHFGLPLGMVFDDVSVSALPNRAYRKIFNDWFRDENLQITQAFLTTNGPDAASTYKFDDLGDLQKRGKRHDYFTSCLPAPQRGTAVALPLGDRAIIMAQTVGQTDPSAGDILGVQLGTTSVVHRIDTDAAVADISATTTASIPLYADLSSAIGVNVNDVRLAFATQHILERDARSGTRYVESLKARWGVTSPDFRLQRAEYLGGGSTRVMVNPVQQNTAASTPTVPAAQDKLGNLAGIGTASGTHSWSKSFVEHGVVIILGNLRGDISYSQGVDRYWSKSTRYDFVYPELANIGEQSVLNKEIWNTVGASQTANNAVFGYQGRYDEHRFLNSKITGIMRPDAAGTLASWHLSEDFAALPTLGATFIQANTSTPLDRAIAITTEPHMIADFYHEIKAALPLPTYGVPGLTRL